jgi:hypothetical protein
MPCLLRATRVKGADVQLRGGEALAGRAASTREGFEPISSGSRKGLPSHYASTWESLDSLEFPRILLADRASIPRNTSDRQRLFLETKWMPFESPSTVLLGLPNLWRSTRAAVRP